jgi:hypothetical protein
MRAGRRASEKVYSVHFAAETDLAAEAGCSRDTSAGLEAIQMSEPGKTKKKAPTDWAMVAYVWLPVIIVLGAAFVGFVKFMAWWRVAFGDCSP